jgi:spindle assembly checkpoint component MAD3
MLCCMKNMPPPLREPDGKLQPDFRRGSSLKYGFVDRRSEADGAYLLGIARQAAPLDRLVAKHGEFQKRMMSAASMPPPPAPNAPPRRTALAVASSSSTAPPSGSISRVPSSSHQADTRRSASGSRLGSNGRLQIFVDPSGTESAGAVDSLNPYPDVGTRKSRVKENIPEVSKASGSTLKQAGRTRRIASGSSSVVPSTIIPFRDPLPDDDVEMRGAMPPPPVPMSRQKDAVPKTPARNNSIVPSHEVSDGGGIPSTPRFTPFRDEVSSFSTLPRGPC